MCIRDSGRTILIIDDDPQIVAAMERELTDRGAHPVAFFSANDISPYFWSGQRLDVAVIDYDLGNGQTGPGVLDAIERARCEHIPALILTGGTDAATLAAVMRIGRPWLTKPADPDEVASALVDLIAAAATT